MIIALTGNIGSGKSTTAGILTEKGYVHIDADQVCHELYEKEDIKWQVVERFGKGVLTNERIDRPKLKQIVFQEPGELVALNTIMHPAIVEEMHKRVDNVGKYVVEGALLVEAGFTWYDTLIVLTIDRNIQKQRLLKKGKHTSQEIDAILASQMPQEKKAEKADLVIDNSGSLEELREQLQTL